MKDPTMQSIINMRNPGDRRVRPAATVLAALLLIVVPASGGPTRSAVEHGARSGKMIALTFDACSTVKPSGYDPRIPEILIRMGTPATIFLGGKWVADEWAHAAPLLSNPLFEFGNHTFLHPHLTACSDARVRQELERTQEEIKRETGRVPTLFRPPYGEFDGRIVRIAWDEGLRTVEYDLPSGDPDSHASKEKLVEYVTRKARAGSIIVMHINGRGWHTAEALPDIIQRLRQRGYEFVTVSELLSGERIADATSRRSACRLSGRVSGFGSVRPINLTEGGVP